MTTLNDVFEHELTQEDERYESGSERLNIFAPLCRAPRLYHISTCKYLAFNPATSLTLADPHPAFQSIVKYVAI